MKNDFASFLACSGAFNDADSKTERSTMEPLNWWTMHGAEAPHLQHLAAQILRQVYSCIHLQ